LRPASEAASRETVVVAGLTALALLVTALSTLAVVRVALRPLGRVAATDAEVAALPLSRDQFAISPRVPESDTDARTEVGLVGDTLNRLLDHVERALTQVAASDRRMRQFITDASHELRTPLAAIQGYVSAPTHQWVTRVPEQPVLVWGDRAKLHQAVANLLSNARVHTPDGTTVTATITSADASARATLVVADDGPGIDAAVLPHLFERFVRADKSRSRQAGNSFGLGLAITAAIVEAHQGSIIADSSDGLTTFTMLLPLTASASGSPSATRLALTT
jgi:signal transduction histidine kinase